MFILGLIVGSMISLFLVCALCVAKESDNNETK